MAIPFKQFVEELPVRLAAAEAAQERCSQPGCMNKASGSYMLGDKPVCSDCYFEYLGNLVEQHPIGRGRSHGGCGPID